ncbi:MAG: DUF6817 domain-containing protein, partial [Acidimicrobiales bacterium]
MSPLAPRRLALDFLLLHGADRVPHLQGTLLEHLLATESILATWGCPEGLRRAGLCHAAYGTDGFAPCLVPWSDRAVVAAAVGPAVEQTVYLYAACDRAVVYPQLAGGAVRFDEGADVELDVDDDPGRPARERTVRFRDRFLGCDTELSATDVCLRTFVDLTLANEMEIAVGADGARPAPLWARWLVAQMARYA